MDKVRLIVADSVAENRSVAERVLACDAIEVVAVASNGKAVLEKLDKEASNVILLGTNLTE